MLTLGAQCRILISRQTQTERKIMITKYHAYLDGSAGRVDFHFNTLEELEAGVDKMRRVYDAQGGFRSNGTRIYIHDGFNFNPVVEKKYWETFPSFYRKFKAHVELVSSYVESNPDCLDHRAFAFIHTEKLNEFKKGLKC